VLRGCLRCSFSTTVPLPSLRKKILYLDQFFFSHAFHARDPRFVAATGRIRQISALQLLTVPFSSIHEDETNQWRGYSGKNKDDLMKFIKDTSRGHEFEPAYEVEKTQIDRAFEGFISGGASTFQLHPDDAVEQGIHAWDDYIRIDVGRYVGDIELMRGLKRQSVGALVDAFDDWRQSTNSFEEQIAIEIRDTAKGHIDAYTEFVGRIANGDHDAVWNAPLISRIVEALIRNLPPEDANGLRKIGQFFSSEYFKQVPHLWLPSRISATLKDMVMHGAYRDSDDAKTRLSGFFQDIKHVATYAPYCDAFVMDKAMASLVADPRINLEGRYSIKVFTLHNWDQFLGWLNEIEAGMAQEHRAALSAIYA
jgi:hypothetical protein